MLQLDLFGGEPAKPAQPKKKGYQLVKPEVLTVNEKEVDAASQPEVVSASVPQTTAIAQPEMVSASVPQTTAIAQPEVLTANETKDAALSSSTEQVSEQPKMPEEVSGSLAETESQQPEAVKKTRTRIPLDISKLNPSSSKINVPEDEELFSKQYYPIGEVATMFNVNISLIRFWEKEFDILQPRKNGKGDRLFRPEDIKNLKMIFFLLKEKKYTIEGAKTFLKKGKKATQGLETVETLKNIKKMLIVLKSGL
jgi:DNA-binding transcriptional MerR regulator